MADQRHLLLVVIDDQRPVVQAHGHISQGDIARCLFRQLFKAASEIVTEQAKCPALEGQVRVWRAGQAHRINGLLQQR
ncbi:hypothetical protein D3C75_975180 [compost metagenome]